MGAELGHKIPQLDAAETLEIPLGPGIDFGDQPTGLFDRMGEKTQPAPLAHGVDQPLRAGRKRRHVFLHTQSQAMVVFRLQAGVVDLDIEQGQDAVAPAFLRLVEEDIVVGDDDEIQLRPARGGDQFLRAARAIAEGGVHVDVAAVFVKREARTVRRGHGVSLLGGDHRWASRRIRRRGVFGGCPRPTTDSGRSVCGRRRDSRCGQPCGRPGGAGRA